MAYSAYALRQIGDIWSAEIEDSKLPKPGEWGGWNTVNISYFAPAYYRVFATLDSGHDWAAVVQTVYDTISYAVNSANGNQSNGLVPAWCDDSHGSPCTPVDMGIANDVGYQYDSCRTPFRIGVDWCWNGETRAQTYVGLTSTFFSAIGASSIADSYTITGTPQPQHPGGHSAAFVGTAGVGAMSSPTYSTFLDDAYTGVATLTYLAGGTYYEDSWTVMSLLMMSANFLDYTSQ
jgi:endo-1,4-beta-D-glucanase Y